MILWYAICLNIVLKAPRHGMLVHRTLIHIPTILSMRAPISFIRYTRHACHTGVKSEI